VHILLHAVPLISPLFSHALCYLLSGQMNDDFMKFSIVTLSISLPFAFSGKTRLRNDLCVEWDVK